MTAHVKSIIIHAFHYIPADPIDLASNSGGEAGVQRVRIENDLKKLNIFDVKAHVENVPGLFEDEEADTLLTVTQSGANGPSDVYVLRPEEWLAEDFSATSGYRVFTGIEFARYLASTTTR